MTDTVTIKQRVRLWKDSPFTVEFNGVHFIFRHGIKMNTFTHHITGIGRAVYFARFLGAGSASDSKDIIDEAVRLYNS